MLKEHAECVHTRVIMLKEHAECVLCMMFQSLHEELLRQQESFDSLAEQAQVLMQSSTDSRVSTQLTQMNTRYSALITVSKVSFTRRKLVQQLV